MKQRTVFLTGLRANNNLHIGNYLGGIMPIVNMANSDNDSQINLFVPDLHSIISDYDTSKLQTAIFDNIKNSIAAGLPLSKDNVYIYRQSYIPAHSELTWILDCFSGFGELSRMIEFKEKSEKAGKSNVGVGLFNYPVLMASDILLYDTNYVPVGDDQRQHLEFARSIANKFNSKFGEIFVIPKSTKEHDSNFERDQALRIKDLQDPSKKMSKSTESEKGVIFLNDKPDIARAKIMSATTDSIGTINYDQAKQPGISNLFDIMQYFSNKSHDEIVAKYNGSTKYAEFKSDVADVVCQFLIQFQKNMANIDNQEIIDKLEFSEAEMNKQANKKLLSVQKAIGLR